MKVLVTGGTGYIGSHTVVELIEAKHEVIIVDNLSNSSEKVIERIEKITGVAPKFINADVTNSSEMKLVFKENNFDAVIHFAAFKAVGESVEQPLMYYRNNLDGLLTILELMAEFKVTKLVFSSSCTIYGNSEDLPLDEDTATTIELPSPYGKTKAMAEQILSDSARANQTLEITSLRYFNPVGAHPSGLIGDNPLGVPNCLLPYIVQVVAGKLDKLSVYGNDYPTTDGTCIRDYLHVVDLAKAHLAALNNSEQSGENTVYNLGTGTGSSVLDVIDAFEKSTGQKINYEIVGRRSGDITASYANPKKAEQELNWKAAKSLEQMCQDAWNWQKLNPNGYDES